MTDPDRMGSHRDQNADEGITLPSWVDAAIAKARSDEGAPPPYAEEPLEADASSAEAGDAWSDESAPGADIESGAPEGEEYYDAPAKDDFERTPASMRSDTPFPSFLDRRPAFRRAAEPIEAGGAPESSGPIPEHGSPLAFAQQPAADEYEGYAEFDQQRAQIVSEALAESSESPSTPRPDAIPLPVAPVRRRGASGPWLIAALFFAAAALVLAVLMWVRPLPR